MRKRGRAGRARDAAEAASPKRAIGEDPAPRARATAAPRTDSTPPSSLRRAKRVAKAPSRGEPIAREPRRGSDPVLEATYDLDDASDASFRFVVHDASRLEWTVTLPLPESGELRYAIDASFDIPANAFVPHAPWDQLQSVSRFDGASWQHGADATLDALRVGAIAATQKLARAHEGFAEEAALAGASADAEQLGGSLALLGVWLTTATKVVDEVRATLSVRRVEDDEPVARERTLVDEYVSARFIEMLAGAKRSLLALERAIGARVAGGTALVERVEEAVARALETELVHRSARGYVCADASCAATLERYVRRSSRLKKHFHEVLFLHMETREVAKWIHHWVAAFVALVASLWAFAWQSALSTRANGSSAVGARVMAFAAVAGLIYATKDRLKEVGRTWISGHVHRLYGQRIVRLRADARRVPARELVASARESFDRVDREKPDPVHPKSGAVQRVMVLHFRHIGVLYARPRIAARGARNVKFVFRYDFSPMFSRLGDAVQEVAVLDARSRRLALTGAARRYYVAIDGAVTYDGERHGDEARLVLSKQGLERLERGRPSSIPE